MKNAIWPVKEFFETGIKLCNSLFLLFDLLPLYKKKKIRNQFSVTFFAFREIFLQRDAVFSDFMFTFVKKNSKYGR